MTSFDVRELRPGDVPEAERLFDAEIAGRVQARLGELVDVLALPGFGGWRGTDLVGVATFALAGDRAELAAIAVRRAHRSQGVGSALIEAVVAAATTGGARELWLVTTNDNIDALRLYQRRGFRLDRLEPGSVERARELKPTIPLVGDHDIPMRDELVLVRPLVS